MGLLSWIGGHVCSGRPTLHKSSPKSVARSVGTRWCLGHQVVLVSGGFVVGPSCERRGHGGVMTGLSVVVVGIRTGGLCIVIV